MPSGFQNRFTYGAPMNSRGFNGTTSWDRTVTPLNGYEAVYSFRSGKRAKELSQAGKYSSLVRSGSLSDQMRRRTEYLNNAIKENLTPTSGSTAAFSCTGDTGHPFSSYKLRSFGNPMHVSYVGGASWLEADVWLSSQLPWPNFADPFGNAITDGTPDKRFTYFSWPTTGNYISRAAPSLANQIVSNAVKNSVGAGVIASANPWKPKANLAVSILELMSGDIPSVTKNLRKHIYNLQSLKHSGAKDWLNVQFGWVPLIDDIRATVQVFFNLHMLLYGDGEDTYRRSRGNDIGTWARMADTAASRTMTFGSPLNQSTTASPYLVNATGGIPQLSPPPIPAGVGSWSRSTRIETDFRFSAKYHRGADPNRKEFDFIRKGTELLGLEVTPAVLWELTPWTWLLDWGSNLGSVASNLSMLDWSNVLLDYAYLTFVVKTTGSVSVKLPSSQLNATTSVNGTYFAQGFESIEKIREQASPYGFGVSWDGLNPFQLSILAALGMSRGR